MGKLIPARLLLLAIAGALSLAPAPALAEDCPILKEALKEKEEEALAFDARNRAMLASLIATETSCKNKGATISGDLAKAAAALTCQALQDANQVNQQMESLGKICTDAFTKRNQLQQILQTSYGEMIAEVEDGTDYILKSQILMEDCPKQTKRAKQLRTRARELATEIANVELRSRDGKVNYGKFTDAAAAMALLTAARNKGCATDVIEREAGNREAAGQKELARAPAPPPAVKRVEGHGPSDVTGTGKREEKIDSYGAAAAIRRPRAQGDSAVTDFGADELPPSMRQASGVGTVAGLGAGGGMGNAGGKPGSAGKGARVVDRVQPRPEELLGDIALLAGSGAGGEASGIMTPDAPGGIGAGHAANDSVGHAGAALPDSPGVRALASSEPSGGETEKRRAAEAVKKLAEEEALDGLSGLRGLRNEGPENPDAVAGLDSIDTPLFQRVALKYRKRERSLRAQ